MIPKTILPILPNVVSTFLYRKLMRYHLRQKFNAPKSENLI